MPQFGRKFYHMAMGLICFCLYAFVLTRSQALFLLATVGGIWVLFDVIRLRNPSVNLLTLKLFGKLMRREELKSISGNSFYIIGLATLVLFFPKPVALFSVLFLALGDPTAAIVGTLFGKHKILGKKSLEGAMANFAVTALASFLLSLFYFHLSMEAALGMALIGGLASTIAELTPFPVDDNFSLPVVSACLLSLALAVFPLI